MVVDVFLRFFKLQSETMKLKLRTTKPIRNFMVVYVRAVVCFRMGVAGNEGSGIARRNNNENIGSGI